MTLAFLVGFCPSCSRELLSRTSGNLACMAGYTPTDFRAFVFQSQLGKLNSHSMIMAVFQIEKALNKRFSV